MPWLRRLLFASNISRVSTLGNKQVRPPTSEQKNNHYLIQGQTFLNSKFCALHSYQFWSKLPPSMPQASNISAEEQTQQKKCQMVTRESIAASFPAISANISHTYWFTIQGDCKLGLGLTMMLSLKSATLLLVSGLINVENKSNYGHLIEVPI